MFNLFGKMIQLVGVFLTGFGIIKLLMAMNNDNPDKQKEAAGSLAVGIIMMAMPTVLKNLGLDTMVSTSNLNGESSTP